MDSLSPVFDKCTVIIPSLARDLHELKRAVNSAKLQGASTQILLVLVRENPEVEELCRSIGASYIIEPRNGIYTAINSAVKSIRKNSKYFLFLGDDDVLKPGAIDALIEGIEISQYLALHGQINYVDKDSRVLFTNPGYWFAQHTLRFFPNLIPNPGTIIRTEAWEELGGYNEGYFWASDLDFFIRLRKFGKIGRINFLTTDFMWNPYGMTAGQRDGSIKEAFAIRLSHGSKWTLLFRYPIVSAFTWLGEIGIRYRLRRYNEK